MQVEHNQRHENTVLQEKNCWLLFLHVNTSDIIFMVIKSR